MRDGVVRTVKLAMYAGAAAVIELLTARLGAPAASSATIAGVQFDDA
jgi:hypothetical protein